MSANGPGSDVLDDAEILKEQSILLGMMFSFLAYGFLALTFILCLRTLSKLPKSTSRRIFNLYVWAVFILITAYMIVNAINKVMAFTTYREYPGGPRFWVKQSQHSALSVTGTVCSIVSIWLSDGFLLYRVVVVYTTRRYVVVFPCCLYVGTVVTGVLFILAQAPPQASLWTTISMGLPYFIISSLCNIFTVVALASRLFLYRYLVRRVVGDNKQEHDVPYGSAVTILIESAALHAAFSAVFVVSYALKSPIARLVVGPLCNVRGISSFLIILRVARHATRSDQIWSNTIDPVIQRRTYNNTRPESITV